MRSMLTRRSMVRLSASGRRLDLLTVQAAQDERVDRVVPPISGRQLRGSWRKRDRLKCPMGVTRFRLRLCHDAAVGLQVAPASIQARRTPISSGVSFGPEGGITITPGAPVTRWMILLSALLPGTITGPE